MGCDLSPAVCERVTKRTGLPIHCGSVEALPNGAFGVVAMHHVLEHVDDPVGFLGGVRRVLAPGGIVHIAVPNPACWEARFSGWPGYAAYHLSYFGARTLTAAVKRAGLATVLDGDP